MKRFAGLCTREGKDEKLRSGYIEAKLPTTKVNEKEHRTRADSLSHNVCRLPSGDIIFIGSPR